MARAPYGPHTVTYSTGGVKGMVVGSLKCRRTHERVLALTAVPRELTGVLLEAPPFRFGETEMPGRNETSAGEKFRRGRPAGPCPPIG